MVGRSSGTGVGHLSPAVVHNRIPGKIQQRSTSRIQQRPASLLQRRPTGRVYPRPAGIDWWSSTLFWQRSTGRLVDWSAAMIHHWSSTGVSHRPTTRVDHCPTRLIHQRFTAGVEQRPSTRVHRLPSAGIGYHSTVLVRHSSAGRIDHRLAERAVRSGSSTVFVAHRHGNVTARQRPRRIVPSWHRRTTHRRWRRTTVGAAFRRQRPSHAGARAAFRVPFIGH